MCEYPQPYTSPGCVSVQQININSEINAFYYTAPLDNGNTYSLFFVGEADYAGTWPGGTSLTIDPYFSSTDDWATQSSATYITFEGGTFTSTTLIDTTYQTDHMYQVDVVGNGSALGVQAWSGGRGGVTLYICDVSVPTPTPTPTASPTPNDPAFARTCILLGSANANFTAGNAWTFYGDGSVDTPDGADSGIQFPTSGAFGTLPLRLNQLSQYRVEVQYRFQVIPDDLPLQRVSVGLGLNQSFTYSIDDSLFVQYAAFGPFNFIPDDGELFTLTISRPALQSGIEDPQFVVDWICVTQTSAGLEPNPNPGGGPSDGSTPGDDGSGGTGSGVQCETCPEYAPQGGLDHLVDDFGQIIGWLWCRLGGAIGCLLGNLLAGLWFTLRNLLGFFANVMVWVGKTGRGFFEWLHILNVDIWAWALGTTRNGTTMVGNSTTAVLNGLLGIKDGNTPSNNGGLDGIIRFIEWWIDLFRSAANLGTQVLGLGQRGIRVYNIFMDSLNEGLAPGSSSLLSASSAITARDAIYYVRLGFYVMDNTIFAGPFWYWVGTSQFLVGLMVLIWVVNSFKNLLKR